MKRPVRTLIQFIAAAMVIFGGLEIGLEIERHQLQVRNHAQPIINNFWHYLIGGVLIFAGIILFLGSRSLAEQLTDDVDDDDQEEE